MEPPDPTCSPSWIVGDLKVRPATEDTAPEVVRLAGLKDESMGLDARDAGWRESARVIFTWRLCRDAIAVGRAHAQFRFASGWKVNAELPGPPGSASATRFDLALVQIGGDHQDEFFSFAEKELLSALKEL